MIYKRIQSTEDNNKDTLGWNCYRRMKKYQ